MVNLPQRATDPDPQTTGDALVWLLAHVERTDSRLVIEHLANLGGWAVGVESADRRDRTVRAAPDLPLALTLLVERVRLAGH